MAENIAKWFEDTLGLAPEWVVFFISMIPIVELRGGILVAGGLFGIPIWKACIFCIIGNIIPIPFILKLITPIFAWMKTTRLFRNIAIKLENKAMGKSDKVKKYEFIGLMLFVGIPLPGTGAWTGALIASLIDVEFKKAMKAIFCGLLLASTIMCIITYFIPWVVEQF